MIILSQRDRCNKMRVLALIPARGGSKGIPGKNIRKLNGIPLIGHTIRAAKKVSRISHIVVSTDSPEIAQVAGKYGADVPFIRPDYLASDQASVIDVVIHAIEYFEKKGIYYSELVLLQPTSPLRDELDINNSLDIYLEKECDSVISVCKAQAHPFLYKTIDSNGRLQDFIPQADKHMRRQDMPVAYQLNGAIYISSVQLLKKQRNFYGRVTFPYEMDIIKSIDIDTELDFKLAELIIKERGKIAPDK